jgi:hypothetical protein
MDQDVKQERQRPELPQPRKPRADATEPQREPGNGEYDEEVEGSFPASDPPSSTQP